jgi:hypothetical protein
MATSIFDPPAFIQACSALTDKVERILVSISTGPNRAEELVEETAGARGARILVTGTAADALARSVRCKTLAAASVTLRLRAPVRAPQGNARSGFMKRNTAPTANCGLLHTRQSAKA